MFGGIGSEAISAVPVRANTRSTSGTWLSTLCSRRCCKATDWLKLVPGTRNACKAKSPSLKLGTNSLPIRLANTPDNRTITPARVNARVRCPMTHCNSGA
ncbi:hypothetical protein D3C72_1641820 [compost metagenome]